MEVGSHLQLQVPAAGTRSWAMRDPALPSCPCACPQLCTTGKTASPCNRLTKLCCAELCCAALCSPYRKVMRATHSWPSLKPEKSNLPAVALVSGAVTTFCGRVGR